jgi:hypothetical protein
MKFEPIKPAPPVTSIVFSMNENCAELYGTIEAPSTAVWKRTSIVNKKDGSHSVLWGKHSVCLRLLAFRFEQNNMSAVYPVLRSIDGIGSATFPAAFLGCIAANSQPIIL